MYLYNTLTAFLTMLCRVSGVTPDTIKTVKDKSNGLRLTPREAAARVNGMGI